MCGYTFGVIGEIEEYFEDLTKDFYKKGMGTLKKQKPDWKKTMLMDKAKRKEKKKIFFYLIPIFIDPYIIYLREKHASPTHFAAKLKLLRFFCSRAKRI